ncbi:hypothetical protein DPMN_000229 [Dreissena polymorpha]|uniref:BEN domain-containing protein n=1 Tax=Dreissena polymorpha TaxID=45954 RepID=A0A9D4RPR6_DREPO|nr:hypothetical protein DPMN_000229 [Dreissena polymorpha]
MIAYVILSSTRIVERAVQIANDLELTELKNSVEFSDSAESSYVSAFHKPETPSKRKCVGSAIRGGLLALDHDSKEIHDMDQSPFSTYNIKSSVPLSADCSCGCKAEIERLSAKCKTFEQEFTATWYWINLMYNQIQQKQLPNTPSHMQLLQGSSGHGQLQMPTMEEAPQPLTLMTTPVKTPHVLSSEIKKTTVPTYGGFTKSQLIEEKAGFGVEDYPKAAKRLFQRIYKEEEWQGHTLTGTKANNKYDGRPAIEDPSRMNIIYEIMQEQYRVTPVQVREKIRDLLKPSKLKKQF